MTDKPKDKHPAAVALGKLIKGRPKRISDDERKRRSESMMKNRKIWPKKEKREVGQ